MSVLELVRRLEERIEELEREREEILKEMAKLTPLKGTVCLERVRNKTGMVYHYWYHYWYEGGKRHKAYIGPTLPESYEKALRDKEKYMQLKARLKAIEKELMRLRKKLKRIF
mgnify:CR=1 FL=1